MNVYMRCFFLLVILMTILSGCDDEDGPKGKYEDGVFVVNEGTFKAGNGSVTYYNSSGEVEQNIFRNSVGNFAGDVVQSLKFHEERAYLVINEDSKIEVVNGNTFGTINTITHADIDKPRYIEVIDGKAYISVWGPYDENFSLIDSYVLVYDLSSGSVITRIDTDEGTENLLFDGERLFASNFNYGASSTVSVINPDDNSLIDNVEVSAGPAGMVTDANGKLWVVCVGGFGDTNGYLYRINPETLQVEEDIIITGVPGGDIAVTPDKGSIIYSVGTAIYSLPINATEEAVEPAFEAADVTSLYALSVDPETGDIYAGDAPSFTAIGKVYVYSPSGTKITSFDTGILPTEIVFK
jgi:hypothetical protein